MLNAFQSCGDIPSESKGNIQPSGMQPLRNRRPSYYHVRPDRSDFTEDCLRL